MICQKCNKKFQRVPPHKRQRGVLISSRAKLCPKCRGIRKRCIICKSEIGFTTRPKKTCSKKCSEINNQRVQEKYRKNQILLKFSIKN